MKKLFKILITGVFLTGFIASVTCLVYSSRTAIASCHNKTPIKSTEDNSCLSHCLKQKITAINIENQSLKELNSQATFFVNSFAPVNLQFVSVIPQVNPIRYINQSRFTPLFNHSPPLLI